MTPLDKLLHKLPDAQRSGNNWSACCPAHDDHRASLSISEGRGGKAVVKCHAGCSFDAIAKAVGMKAAEFFAKSAAKNSTSTRPKPEADKQPGGKCYTRPRDAVADLQRILGPRSARWIYRDDDRKLVGIISRWNLPNGKKTIRPVSLHGDGWHIAAMSSPRPLYNLAELADAERAYVVEGEPAAEALRAIGLTATTSAGGCGAPRKTDWSPLAGKDLVLLPDNDEPGRKFIDTVAAILATLEPVPVARIVDLPDLPEGGDVVDFIAAHPEMSAVKLRRVIKAMAAEAEPIALEKMASEDAAPSTRSHRSDTGNAELFLDMFGDDVRFCHGWNKWLVWDSKRWRVDDRRHTMVLAKRVGKRLWKDADASDERTWANQTLNRGRLTGMLEVAASDPRIAVMPDQLDTPRLLLNCPNGAVDLETGELREARREDFITKLCPTEYDPAAKCPRWKKCLNAIFEGDRELIAFVQEWFGYCATGDVSEQLLPFFYGDGSNGKSTLVETIAKVIGKDFVIASQAKVILAAKWDRHPTELADFHGARCVTMSEIDGEKTLAEGIVKQLTGGDRIRARRLYEDFWEFEPTHKIILLTNSRPTIQGNDHAIWRRIILVPFLVRFWEPGKEARGKPELRAIRNLPKLLAKEAPGILAWVVRGCVRWRKRGRLELPEKVKLATQQYRTDEDLVGRYVGERCKRVSGNTLLRDLYEDFKFWCVSQGEEEISKKMFAQKLQQLGFDKNKTGDRRYRGIKIIGSD